MKKWGTLIILSFAMFIIVIDTTVMNVSISALVEDLDTTVQGIQSAISLYALVMASFILIGGKLADFIGKKRTFVIGLILFGIGSFTAAISQSLGMLIIGWSVIEGLGSALMIPNIQTILRDRYEGKDRATGYGLIGAVGAVGAAVGPIVGGFLTTYYTWRYAFLGEVLIVVLILIFSGVIKKDVLPKIKPKFDYKGSIMTVAGLGTFVMGIITISKYGFIFASQSLVIGDVQIDFFGISFSTILMFVGAMIIWQLFRYEGRREEEGEVGLFKPSIFKNHDFNSSEGVRFLNMFVTAGALYLFPLFMQLTFELDAIETGVRLMPFSLALMGAAIIGSRLSGRFSAKKIIQVGLAVYGAAALVMASVIGEGFFDINITLVSIVFGAGLGLVASQIVNLILSTVKPEETSEAAGINGTIEQLGNSIGVALVGTIMLAGLINVATDLVVESKVIPNEYQQAVVQEIENGVQLASDSVIQNALEETSITIERKEELGSIYTEARLTGFQMAVFVLFLATVLAFFISFQLPEKKLVSE